MQNPIYRRPSQAKQLFAGLLFGAVAFLPAFAAFLYKTGGM